MNEKREERGRGEGESIEGSRGIEVSKYRGGRGEERVSRGACRGERREPYLINKIQMQECNPSCEEVAKETFPGIVEKVEGHR